ncbi:MAG: 2-oxoacid:acceptor oxidoreductase subunit alpha [Chitinophagaceae bacterium]|nr:MAG: 2-oxoacid:acceptor oxidoreductase subunit alpha [Chitinophagaceae bacterium]
MASKIEKKEEVVIKFAGDSGDGMQLTGNQFTNNTALFGNDVATFPDYPAEIRAPLGTLAGVSGFQLHFGSREIDTPGDSCDVLVAMNAAALKSNLKFVKNGGIVIVNTAGFDNKNLRLAHYEINPLDDETLSNHLVYKIDITKLTRESLVDFEMGTKDKDRSKNMFVLGFLFWMFNRSMDNTIGFLEAKFKKNPNIAQANIKALKAGYNFGDTTETFTTRFEVDPAKLPPGKYRGVMGGQATAYGLIAASKIAGIDLFLGSYPITPASDILHELSKHKNFNVFTFQAEDEIASICAAIGASFGGKLAVTTTSGPGMALKTEAMGLAVSLEIPLVICDVQRAGPSTGMPTKTEQSDLLMALYGRNGECPMPVISASSPSDSFEAVYEAARIALEHMTPVIFLSDGYNANGAEPWKYPSAKDLKKIEVSFAKKAEDDAPFMPYQRNEKLVRPWAIPGTKGLEHRLGGLEKQHLTGDISYDADNHEFMVKMRESKVEKIADFIPLQKTDNDVNEGKLAIVGWGSTYGAIRSAVRELNKQGEEVAHIHIRYLKPFPKNLEELLNKFDNILIPEINNGQLVKVIRDKFMINAIGFSKIKGVPFTKQEIIDKALEITAKKKESVSN